jgi:hypothetical protein
LRKIVIKCYFEEYFGIDTQMKVVNHELLILSIQLNSLILSPLFYYKI